MSKKLKVSFAMGGGVSLGSFSGASLTEILKLLILFGKDETGTPYKGIVLDSFSGASAGAISLAIMVRALIDYKTILKKLQEKDPSLTIKALKKQLSDDYGAQHIKALSPEKSEQLLAAEVCQQLQKVLWVDNISIESLFGIEKKNARKSKTSLIERDYLSNSSAEYLLYGIDQLDRSGGAIQDTIQLLAKDRILFACSLTNLSSISRTKQYSEDPIIKSFQRSFNDYDHKELRVIDFQFQDGLKSAPRWLSMGHKDFGCDFDIKNIASWSMFASSAIACGAFPVAFAPAVLERQKKEMDLPRDVEEIQGDTLKFAYIDGGTFNNEPISEAFKLANYIDFNDPTPKTDYDRIVFFVDPIVSSQDLSYNIDFLQHDQAKYHKQKKGFRLKSIQQRNVSGNLGAYTSKLMGVLRREGVVKEGLKIRSYLQDYQQLQMLEDAYRNSSFDLRGESLRALLYVLIKYTEGKIKNLHIPPGTHEPIQFLEAKYQQILYSKFGIKLSKAEQKEFKTLLKGVNEKPIAEEMAEDLGLEKMIKNIQQIEPVQAYRSYKKIVKKMMDTDSYPKIKSKLVDPITDFFNEKKSIARSSAGDAISDSNDRKKALSFLLLQLLLGTYDKDSNAYLVAVTPIDFYRTDKDFKDLETMELPGGEFEAFAGFASKESRDIAFAQGRYCSVSILERGSFRIAKNEDAALIQGNELPAPNPIVNPADVAPIKNQILKEIEEQFSKNEQYLPRYQSTLSKKLKVIGANRLYYILLQAVRINGLKLLFASFLGAITSFATIFIAFPKIVRNLLDWLFINKAFYKKIKYHPESEVMLQIHHEDFTRKKAKIKVNNSDAQMLKLKLKIDRPNHKIYLLLPYTEEKGELFFYFSKYRKRAINTNEFHPSKVIDHLIVSQKGIPDIKVDLSKFLKDKRDRNRLKYFINPFLEVSWEKTSKNYECHSEVMDAAIPLKKQILAYFNNLPQIAP